MCGNTILKGVTKFFHKLAKTTVLVVGKLYPYFFKMLLGLPHDFCVKSVSIDENKIIMFLNCLKKLYIIFSNIAMALQTSCSPLYMICPQCNSSVGTSTNTPIIDLRLLPCCEMFEYVLSMNVFNVNRNCASVSIVLKRNMDGMPLLSFHYRYNFHIQGVPKKCNPPLFSLFLQNSLSNFRNDFMVKENDILEINRYNFNQIQLFMSKL